MTKNCLFCKCDFDTTHRAQRYCSKSCAAKGVSTFDIASVATQGGRALRGRPQSPEHAARRAASIKRTLEATRRACCECGEQYTPGLAAQKYCSGRCSESVRKRRSYGTLTAAQRQATRYRVTSEERAALHSMQDGLCAICRKPGDRRQLCVDHCHTTGRVRGLLCNKCNTTLGLMGDDCERLLAAVEYLKTHSVRQLREAQPPA